MFQIIEKMSTMHRRVQDAYKEMEQVRRRNEALENRLDSTVAELNTTRDERQRLRQVLQAHSAQECQHEVNHTTPHHTTRLDTVSLDIQYASYLTKPQYRLPLYCQLKQYINSQKAGTDESLLRQNLSGCCLP